MFGRRLAVVALSVAVLGATGCGGGSDAPAPAAPAAPPAATAPVADRSGGADGSIGRDIEKERVAAKRALRTWGVAAERACRKAERKIEPWLARLTKITWKSRADFKRNGRMIVDLARAAEYEYEVLRNVALPTQAEAIDAIHAFFDKEEEALMLVQRIGVELEMLNDPDGILRSLARLNRLEDDYRRAGRAVGAYSCVDRD
jgi:hypothetical protein